MPPPPITLCGARSLNRNSSPGWRARKFAAEGAQKLTSPRSGCRRSFSNQSPSVTAMTRLMPIYKFCVSSLRATFITSSRQGTNRDNSLSLFSL